MPFKCCIPRCSGNYTNGPKVSVFSFPSDASLKAKWISSIPRQNLVINQNTKVCELHFADHEIRRSSEFVNPETGKVSIIKLKQPRLAEGAVPSLFPGCPSYLSSHNLHRESREAKLERQEMRNLDLAIAESEQSYKEYEKKFCFQSLDELKACVSRVPISSVWNVLSQEECVCFYRLDGGCNPKVKQCLTVHADLTVDVYINSFKMSSLLDYTFPCKFRDINHLNSLLEEVKNFDVSNQKSQSVSDIFNFASDLLTYAKNLVGEEKQSVIEFILEQLQLISCSKTQSRYSAQYMVFCCLLASISPHCYEFLRNSNYVIVPHKSTLKRLISCYNVNPMFEQTDNDFLAYIRHKSTYLTEMDKHVILLLDEIHLRPFLDYKGGNIIGASYNCEQAATSAFVFMIQSALSSYKDIVHILPTKTISADALHFYIQKVICRLEELNFNVFCIITDNNAINKKAISYLAKPPKVDCVYDHPSDPKKPLFYLIDSVHLLKCIRNNWQKQRCDGQSFCCPSFSSDSSHLITASLATLKKMYNLEKNNFVKFGYGLTMKCLNPSNLEKQNVKLALQIFNRHVCEGLSLLGKQHNLEHWKGTAEFIKIVTCWWEIINVKTPYKGIHKKNVFQEPLTYQDDDNKLQYLRDMLNWLDRWNVLKLDAGKLSRETHQALCLTINGIIKITEYCINQLNFKYILTGKFQTDVLEDRFGKYRQLSGANYNITLTQVYENESKLRIQDILPLMEFTSIDNNEVWKTSNVLSDIPECLSTIFIEDDSFEDIQHLFPVLTYVAGYCVHSVLNKLQCSFCKSKLTAGRELEFKESYVLIKNLDRGSLLYPHSNVIFCVALNYVVISKLFSPSWENQFMSLTNQRNIASQITLENLVEKSLDLDLTACPASHNNDLVIKSIVWVSTNVFLHNACKIKNDLNVSRGKKRKLQTLIN